MPYLRALAFLLALVLALLCVAPLQALAVRRRWAIRRPIQTGFCRAICAILDLRVVADDLAGVAAPRVFVANHVSWTDVVALASVTPMTFLAKSEVARWPVLGWLARLQGTVFVARGARADVPRVNAALRGALAAGDDLVIFPEGASSDGAAVLPFRPSHFEPLRDMPATLVPVTIHYRDAAGSVDVGWYGDMTFLPHLWALMKRGGAVCRLSFAPPIACEGADRKTLAAEAERRVRAGLESLRA
jgi:1-acyl-sn-glycerol-3-phosphate acyltransferase